MPGESELASGAIGGSENGKGRRERAGREAAEAATKEAINGRSEPALQQRVQGQQVEQCYCSDSATFSFT